MFCISSHDTHDVTIVEVDELFEKIKKMNISKMKHDFSME